MTYANQAEAEADGWHFEQRGELHVAYLSSGQTRFCMSASSPEKLLSRINARAAHRKAMGHTAERSVPTLRTLN